MSVSRQDVVVLTAIEDASGDLTGGATRPTDTRMHDPLALAVAWEFPGVLGEALRRRKPQRMIATPT